MTDAIRLPEGSSDLRGRRAAPPRGAIRTARLHSLFVRYLRHFIVIGCSLAVVVLGILILFDPFKRLPRNLSVKSVGLQGSVVTLEAPNMKGVRQDGQPFELTGTSSTQDILKPNIVNIIDVDAKVGLDDSTTALVTARKGVFDSTQNVVWLSDHVRIKNKDRGYDIRMQRAKLDFKSTELHTDAPVTVILDGGTTVNADRMDITDEGHKIFFEGDVRSVMDDSGSDAPTGTPPAEGK